MYKNPIPNSKGEGRGAKGDPFGKDERQEKRGERIDGRRKTTEYKRLKSPQTLDPST
jgi:hypothetical protein